MEMILISKIKYWNNLNWLLQPFLSRKFNGICIRENINAIYTPEKIAFQEDSL